MRGALFLAWKFLKPRRSVVSVITLTSILGVTLGVAVLMIVLAVMTGFTDLMKQKLIETQAHFQVHNPYGIIYNSDYLVKKITSAGAQASAVVQSPVLVQHSSRQLDTRVVMFGADQEALKKYLSLDKKILKGDLALEGKKIVISSTQAARWRVSVGDRIIIPKWELAKNQNLSFLVRLSLKGFDRIGMINDITRYISFVMSVNIRKFCLGTEDGVFEGYIDLYVNDMSDLEKLTRRLQKIEGIQSVIRTDL